MSLAKWVAALESADAFHKNALLLFSDLVDVVREKTIRASLKDLTSPEGEYWIESSTQSEYLRRWIFDHNGDIRFAAMLVKTKEEFLRGKSAQYKGICHQLGRDPKFPLLLIYGKFEPRDIERFRNDNNVRRQWIRNTMLIETQVEHVVPEISQLRLGEAFVLESNKGMNSWWCERARIVIRDLTAISGSEKLDEVADHLLST